MEGSEPRFIDMDDDCLLFVKSCILGDGCLTHITRQGINTVMISFTHCKAQKGWLQAKADKLNALFNRKCVVGEGEQYDIRTNKTYQTCQYSMTSKQLLPMHKMAYPNGKKRFSEELLKGLKAEHLAVLWADDGGLEPKCRVGRLHMYVSEDECNIISNWVTSICGAVGRFEDYEKSGVGRIRYPATEMAKIVLAIRPYIHQSMSYKVDMQYKSNTKNALTVSSPNKQLPALDTLPKVSGLNWDQWSELAKSVGVSSCRHGSKTELRQRIIDALIVVSGR